MTRTTVLGHAVACATVLTVVLSYALTGGIQATPEGPLPSTILGVVVTAICAAITERLRRLPRLRGLGVVRPLLWAGVIGWATSCYLLLGHPASLRSGSPVRSSLIFAVILVGPFLVYWTVFGVASRFASWRSHEVV